MAIIADPTNSIATGKTKSEFDNLYETERCKVEQRNDFFELLKKYSNDLFFKAFKPA
jgi:hypothetical protein